MTDSNQSTNPALGYASMVSSEVAQACAFGGNKHYAPSVQNGKNPHAVALGSMTSDAKKSSSRANGEQGGRPEGS